MSDARYYVVGDQDVWMIKVKGGEYGSCASRDEAVVFAIDAAQKLGTRGECAHVCMVDDDGRFQSKWTLRSRSSSGQERVIGFVDAEVCEWVQ